MASLSITPELLTRAFQIHDYITSVSLSYPSDEAENIVISLVDERFRPAMFRNPTSRTTQRAQSADPPFYSSDWVVERGRFVSDVKRFVKNYNKQATERLRTRSDTVTPPRKDYFIEVTPVRTPTASSRRSASKGAFYDSIDPLIFPSIEKAFATIAGELNTVDEFNNTTTEVIGSGSEDAFNKPTFTSSSIMLDDNNNYQNTKFIEQQ